MIVRYAVANTPYVSFQKSNTSPILKLLILPQQRFVVSDKLLLKS
jgi:hypothetical protein